MRFNAIRELLFNRAHIEKANGNDHHNKEYCSKSGEFYEHGTPIGGRGHRSDLSAVVSTIAEGETRMEKIAEKHPKAVIMYARGIKNYIQLIRPIQDRNFKTLVYFFYGAPGTGKSRRALAEATEKGGDIYYKPRGDWWDGYRQQDNVIIDDFYGWLKYDELLKITDRYPYQVPIKGGYEKFTTRRIWITTNTTLDRLYRFIGYNDTAIRRRITIMFNFDTNETEIDNEIEHLL